MEEKASAPDFWEDQDQAQQIMKTIAQLRDKVVTWQYLEKQANDLISLIEVSVKEDDLSLENEINEEIQLVESTLKDLEFQLQLSGKYDQRGAILAVHAGAGGTESQDWAEMLLRMYTRWAEKRGYTYELIDNSPGEEAGIKSAMMEIVGDYAYGYLKGERGVHRLVRISPFDASHSRHTSFALIEVMPLIESNVDINMEPEDIRIDTFRSSGPGGQHMQKTSSAVRITHIPTGIVVSCQNERSQFRNKDTALKVLRSRLLERELKKLSKEQAELKGDHVTAEWGNQIRSYVLHPYKMVKDHRTNYETSNITAVLDGDIDDLLRAYLEYTVKS